MREQLYVILERLLVKNNIRVDREELHLQLLSHPSYPSLHALTGVLNHFRINNLALRLPSNLETLEQLPPYFVANVSREGRKQLVLAEQRGERMMLSYDFKEKEILDKAEFLKAWDGIVVVIEKDEYIKTDSAVSNRRRCWTIVAALAALLLIGQLAFGPADYFASLHLVLSLLGFTLSLFLLKHELGAASSLLNRWCNYSPATSCEAVLQSKGARLLGWLSLSDLSLLVFASYSLSWLLLLLHTPLQYQLLALASWAALPFVFYSLYYQAMVVKKWCPLCLGIALVLLLQWGSLWSSSFSLLAFSLSVHSIVLPLLSFLLVALAWGFTKPLLQTKRAYAALQIDHHKFKRNYQLFRLLYNQSEPLSDAEVIPGELVLGHPNAAVEVILYSSPFCRYCRAAHRDMVELLQQAGDRVKVIVRLASEENPDGRNYAFAEQLLHLYHQQGAEATRGALDELFAEGGDPERWLEQQQRPKGHPYKAILIQQIRWSQRNDINFTPALYVNGKSFPQEYKRADLSYFIDGLIEDQQLARRS